MIKLLSLVAATALLIATSVTVNAAGNRSAPGQLYLSHHRTPVPGTHGASGYTPGYKMHHFGHHGEPGASFYAPGHRS